ncbi:taurine transport system permease protein [Seinonella peptonophila]|uniref:Taurine transport system permease protein n=1 Tax=Seinonella peptonophila TaxID=112248 RepID=A0A1M4TXX9_9BACL|nr:ABC transporter permease [Seinonella peptonophila]SHE49274.1 taurine transport system permease protein [Seinonella peptonophila]
MKKMNIKIFSFLSVLILIGIWLLLTLSGWVKPLFLPGPKELYEVITTSYKDVFMHMGYTLIRQLGGFVIGSLAGIIVGLLIASNRYIEAFMDPIIEILRPIPPLAIIPLLILWLGIGALPQMLLVVFGCFVIVIVSTVEAVRNVPRIYINAARTLGANSFSVYRTIVLPAIIPSLVGAIRVAAGASFGLVVAAEFMGAQEGIGYYMIIAQRYLRTDMILLSIIIISALAWLTDQAIRILERRLTRWSERHS